VIWMVPGWHEDAELIAPRPRSRSSYASSAVCRLRAAGLSAWLPGAPPMESFFHATPRAGGLHHRGIVRGRMSRLLDPCPRASARWLWPRELRVVTLALLFHPPERSHPLFPSLLSSVSSRVGLEPLLSCCSSLAGRYIPVLSPSFPSALFLFSSRSFLLSSDRERGGFVARRGPLPLGGRPSPSALLGLRRGGPDESAPPAPGAGRFPPGRHTPGIRRVRGKAPMEPAPDSLTGTRLEAILGNYRWRCPSAAMRNAVS